MKQTVYQSDFIRAFDDMGRGDNFSWQGLRILFDMLEDYEADLGEESELDVIGLCCQYSEYDAPEFIEAYSLQEDYKLWSEDNPPATPIDSVEETSAGHQGEYVKEYLDDKGAHYREDNGTFIVDVDSF